jgi:transposase
MSNLKLREDEWTKIHKFLQACPRVYVGQESQCRRFIEGVLWISRTGAQWRSLPPQYENWNSIYKRFARWSEYEVWAQMHHHFVDDPDMEYLILDSTIVRAHPCAAGASKKKADKLNKP